MTRRRVAWLSVVIALSVAICFAISSCSVGDIDLTGRPCPCSAEFVCDMTQNRCVTPGTLVVDSSAPPAAETGAGPCLGDKCACTTASDCKDPAFPKCDGSKCVECTTGPDTCSAGRYCLPTHQCAPGCKSNEECATLSPTAPFCNIARHQCVNCNVDTDCKNAQKCSPAGACVDACPGGACTGTKQCCAGLCLDTQSDPLNCNACGSACTGKQTSCCAGTCTDPLTTVTNCGQCGMACSTTNGTPSCNAGSCKWACSTGFSHCATGNTGCETSTSANLTQCGSCTTNCNTQVMHASGKACVASNCTFGTCDTGYSDLDGFKNNGCESATSTCGAKLQVCCPGNLCMGQYQCEPLPANDGKCH